MSDIIFNHPARLFWLPLIGIFAALYLIGVAKRRRDVLDFAGPGRGADSDHTPFRSARPTILCLAAGAIIVALAGPAWNPHPKHPLREGRDVVFVLDVSNSMLAADVPPSRLARAKAAIEDCIRSFGNQRVGLTVFAGAPAIACPLTLDHDFFSHVLETTSPTSVTQGGTRIEDALLLTCETLLRDATEGYRDIILISDGGDQGESTAAATDLVNEMGIKLIVLGIGSSGTGARVPDPDRPGEYMLHRGKEVWTRLEAESLRDLAAACTQGAYLPVGTSNMDLGKIYQVLSRQPSPMQFAEQTVTAYDQGFQVFIALSLALLALLVLVPETRCGATPNKALIVALMLTSSAVPVQADPLRDAQRAFENGDFGQAAELYINAATTRPSADVWYNLGNARYRQAHFADAIEAYKAALVQAASEQLLLQASYNLATTYCRLAEKADDEPSAIRLLDAAAGLYRRVLRQDPNSADSGINLELALRARQDLQDELDRARRVAMDIKRKHRPSDRADSPSRESDIKATAGAFNAQYVSADGRVILPPSESPEDILEGQRRLRQRRAAGSRRARKRVRTDW